MFCKHFTALEHFSVHRDSKIIAKYGDPTSNIISSEKNLPLRHPCFCTLVIKRMRMYIFFGKVHNGSFLKETVLSCTCVLLVRRKEEVGNKCFQKTALKPQLIFENVPVQVPVLWALFLL